MGHHTFDATKADRLEDPSRYRYCSRDELVAMVDPGPDSVVADLGSGTGFFTDDVAEFAATVYAVDVQDEMHAYYREKGLPDNVEQVTADVSDLPFGDGELDATFSTMTFHEFATDAALAEVARVLRPDGRFAVVDWSAEGRGEDGPPTAERYDAATAREWLTDAGFEVCRATERPETFALAARFSP